MKLRKRKKSTWSRCMRKRSPSLFVALVLVSLLGANFRLHYFIATRHMMSLQLKTKAATFWGQSITRRILSKNSYKPAPAEAYVLEHAKELGLANPVPQLAPTCHIWKDPSVTPYYNQLHTFLEELDTYNSEVEKFELPLEMEDLRTNIGNGDKNETCNQVQLHPDGLIGIFSQSRQLSYTDSGWVEPLMVPMRHPKLCLEGYQAVLSMDYMVHDFHCLCQRLKPTSKTVFVDIGAALNRELTDSKPPLIYILDLYKKFGIKFDRIYAYEMKEEPLDEVYAKVPEEYRASFRWINVEVTADENSRYNPFTKILNSYTEDDLVIVKLDIDTPAVELALAQQLFTNPQLAKLIDHFYFEHHVNQQEMAPFWGQGPHITETVAESMQLFQNIRKLGIASHYCIIGYRMLRLIQQSASSNSGKASHHYISYET